NVHLHDGSGVVRETSSQTGIEDQAPLRGRALSQLEYLAQISDGWRFLAGARNQVGNSLESRHESAGAIGSDSAEHAYQGFDGLAADATVAHLLRHTFDLDLVELVERDQGASMEFRRHAGSVEDFRQELPMIQSNVKVGESELGERNGHGGAKLRFDRSGER